MCHLVMAKGKMANPGQPWGAFLLGKPGAWTGKDQCLTTEKQVQGRVKLDFTEFTTAHT